MLSEVHITVLLVDDFEAIRQSVSSMLLETGRFQVIGQAADGLEAVQKAEELQPDLILLDIRLPKLDGIAAAGQIRKLSPKSKIVFLTANDHPEIVEEALSTGASGYVVKVEAGRELFEALEAVMQGGQFVSRILLQGNGKICRRKAGA
jgi:DNA-binding NarL/FixJ family response regulator